MSTLNCDHCRLPIPPGELVTELLDSTARQFCCRGCAGAYRIITGAGLADFYRRRDWRENGVPAGVFESEYNHEYLAKFVRPGRDGAEISFLLEGIHCASCIWLIEQLLSRTPGIITAQINFSTHRLRVAFDPERVTPRQLSEIIKGIGYRPRPYTLDAAHSLRAKEQRTLLIRFGTAAFMSMQLMSFSLALYGGYFNGMAPGAKILMQIFSAAITTPLIFYCGWPFLAGAWRSLKNRAPGMDLLIALGVLAAYFYSLVALLHHQEVYFDTAAMIITLLLLGRLLESSARQRAASGIDHLLQLAPATTLKITGATQTVIDSANLLADDLILVRPGDRFPVDGTVVAGSSEVDEAVLTGESLPVLKGPGGRVISGALNLTTAVTVRVTSRAEESFVARVARLVEEAQNRRAPVQALADRLAALFVPMVILLAVATWFYWFMHGMNFGAALLIAVSVLVVACPCALGLATPTAVLVASGTAASLGILFRGGDILEKTARLNTVAFDKTGTLTEGHPRVIAIEPAAGSAAELLALAARLENGSNHPLAVGILAAARRRGIVPEARGGATVIPGQGVWTQSSQGKIIGGNRAFLANHHIEIPPGPATNHTEVYLAVNNVYRGRILLEDLLRAEALPAMAALRRLGCAPFMLTGDNQVTARAIAGQLDIDYIAGMDPAAKTAWVDEQIKRGARVLMVGDGINDGPALAAATVGCAMAGSTDFALETSDLVLTKPNLLKIVEAIELARRAMRIIKQNLFWASCYNLLALPLAAGGKLTPIYAAAAMAASSVCVVVNSLRLAKKQLGAGTRGKYWPRQ